MSKFTPEQEERMKDKAPEMYELLRGIGNYDLDPATRQGIIKVHRLLYEIERLCGKETST
jgi:hypothetical protein